LFLASGACVVHELRLVYCTKKQGSTKEVHHFSSNLRTELWTYDLRRCEVKLSLFVIVKGAIYIYLVEVLCFLPSTHYPLYDFDLRATHARTLLPAALASVSFGFVLVRVLVGKSGFCQGKEFRVNHAQTTRVANFSDAEVIRVRSTR
jgi:hypothetical protein